MAKHVKRLRKGLDIHIKGKAEIIFESKKEVTTFAIKPGDFINIRPIPKLNVKVGDTVNAGDPLFFDKPNPDILYTAPVSGKIIDIVRGEKRAISEIIIEADTEIKYKDFGTGDPDSLSREEITNKLMVSGIWPSIRQRPFGIIADPSNNPKAIFVSCFDSAPLAADNDFIVNKQGEVFQTGLNALRKLTSGKVHLGLNGDPKFKPSSEFSNAKGVTINWFKGPHPSGNVGVHIHHLDPIKKGETVWFLYPQDVLTIGKLFMEGKYNAERIIAVAGPEVKHPRYYRTYIGACVKDFLQENLISENVRVISGNVLTGKKIENDGFLGYYDNLVSVILEGGDHEFLGWLFPAYFRPSFSKSFVSGWLSALKMKKAYRVRSLTYGEERPFVMTGDYERVLPMDIYPIHLLKAIMYNDIEEMEGLGIYELIEEDIALCEFIDTSKTDMQDILRKGLTILEKDG